MSIDQLFKLHDLLDKEMEAARKSGNSRTLESIMQRRTVIQIMLDTALMNTLEERSPELKIDANMFDMKSLSQVLPGVNLKALGTQFTIEFTSDEIAPAAVAPVDLKGMLYELLKNNFVEKIPSAIELYLSTTGKKITPVQAWIEIKELVNDIRHFQMWDASIANKMRTEGPLMAYVSVKKNLPGWSDYDISRLVEDAVRKTAVSSRTPFSEARQLEELISNPFGRMNMKKWSSHPEIDSIVQKYVAENANKDNAPKIAEYVIAIMDPSKRDKIEKGTGGRKPYVEKGY